MITRLKGHYGLIGTKYIEDYIKISQLETMVENQTKTIQDLNEQLDQER